MAAVEAKKINSLSEFQYLFAEQKIQYADQNAGK